MTVQRPYCVKYLTFYRHMLFLHDFYSRLNSLVKMPFNCQNFLYYEKHRTIILVSKTRVHHVISPCYFLIHCCVIWRTKFYIVYNTSKYETDEVITIEVLLLSFTVINDQGKKILSNYHINFSKLQNEIKKFRKGQNAMNEKAESGLTR